MIVRAWVRLVVVLLLAGGLAPIASAQPQHGAPAGGSARREKIKQRIRAMRAYRLTEALALDEQTAGRLFPVLARYDDETDKLLEKRVDINRRLRNVDQIKDPKVIDRLLDEAVGLQRAFWDLEEKRLVDLRKILTPAQTAKLVIVLPEFERKIQNQLRNAIARPKKGAPADDQDDDFEPDEGAAPPKPHAQPPSRAPGNTPPIR
jgi:hypothetical protein